MRQRGSSSEERRIRIKAAGLRVTQPRVEVLQALEASSTPLSHAELVQTLTPLGLDRVTIYRNLNDLSGAGLVRKADLGDHVWRFEVRRNEKEHDQAHAHFVCNECGDVLCLPVESFTIEIAKKAPRALRRRKFEVQLKGECDRCAAG